MIRLMKWEAKPRSKVNVVLTMQSSSDMVLLYLSATLAEYGQLINPQMATEKRSCSIPRARKQIQDVKKRTHFAPL